MQHQPTLQVRQVEVTDPIATARRGDYVDAFAVRLPQPDPHSPETWVRAGLATTPGFVNWVASLLGFKEAPASTADRLGSFRIVASDPELVHLEASLPLVHVALVGRNVDTTRRMLTTVLHYRRPLLFRCIWTVLGFGHRRAVRQVITSMVSTG